MFSPHTGSSSCQAESSSSVRLNFSYCAETSGQGRRCRQLPSRHKEMDDADSSRHALHRGNFNSSSHM